MPNGCPLRAEGIPPAGAAGYESQRDERLPLKFFKGIMPAAARGRGRLLLWGYPNFIIDG